MCDGVIIINTDGLSNETHYCENGHDYYIEILHNGD